MSPVPPELAVACASHWIEPVEVHVKWVLAGV